MIVQKENGMNSIQEDVKRLITERGWEKYHRPRYLVDALSVEVAELMNECLWHTPDQVDKLFLEHNEAIVKELADIAINFFSLIHFSGVDIEKEVHEKVEELLSRYGNLNPGEHRK